MEGSSDEEYDYERRQRGRRRPSPPLRVVTETRRSQQFLSPNIDGLYRTRSQGHGPMPVVNIYNDTMADASARNDNLSPAAAYTPYGDYRGYRGRSRSQRRSDAGLFDPRSDLVERELRRRDREIWELERDLEEVQLQRIRDERRKPEGETKKEERQRIIDEYERQKREEKEAEKQLREKIEREKIEEKEKKEREYNDFLREKKEKEDKEAAEKKKHEEEIDEEMRKRMLANGYSLRQIEAMISDERLKRTTVTTTPYNNTSLALLNAPRAPVYAKVHKDYLSIETLKYYGIPYEYDRIDSNFIIILREMDKYQTEVLFEHTRKYRAGKLLEPAKKDKNLAWFRKRSRSKSRTRKVGILEFTK